MLHHWLLEQLSPEGQEKFIIEQVKIEEECEQIERWHWRPEEAMNLTQEQIEFLRKNEITVSTAYIGMARLYRGNRTIFQTSAMASVMSALFDSEESFKTDYDGLSKQVHEYLNFVMSEEPEVQESMLENNMPLFREGELDQMSKAMLERQE